MTLVNDDGVFKLQEPVPEAMKNRRVIHVLVLDEDETAAAHESTSKQDAEDGWKLMQSLKGCVTETVPGESIGRDHDKYLYGR